jgi:hypothetical protein
MIFFGMWTSYGLVVMIQVTELYPNRQTGSISDDP